ncbi:MAG: MATE family efflux transporter [Butyrivibrio sp.]|jgi:putative MATE family efflux protein|uniref:MATE family efflux transporter n=1 Tax=Butyrivibrio sp. TaxID=28121 RepID=UPI001EBBD545|nr:MATE family efflux transporter [Butyrivibrio sp.]MBE5840622.1 MATE family efflux transporter [Butyrivibrio sp.]
MGKKYVTDMTSGNEIMLLVKFTIPMLLGNLFQQFYNLADTVIVGQFGGEYGLPSIGAVGSVNFLFFSLCLGMGAGVGIMISQNFGAGKDEYVRKIVGNSIYITLAAGILMSIVSVVFARPILTLMDTPPECMADALLYMRIVCGATFLVAGYNMISSILRALGDSKTPLVFLVVACVINIVLDLITVVGLHMGVAGAAIATVFSQTIAMIGSIVVGVKRNPYLQLQPIHRELDTDIIDKSIRLGIPLALQNALIAFSCVALQRVVNSFGSDVMSAYTATGRIEQLVQQPFGSLGTAVSTFAGQNAGAKKLDRVKSGCVKSVMLVAAFSLLMVAVMFAFGENIIRFFTPNAEAIKIGARGLRITSLFYFTLGLIYVFRGMLNGVGDAAFALINGIIEVVGRIGFATILMAIPGVGIWGCWYTNGLTWAITGIGCVIRYMKGRWRKKVFA